MAPKARRSRDIRKATIITVLRKKGKKKKVREIEKDRES